MKDQLVNSRIIGESEVVTPRALWNRLPISTPIRERLIARRAELEAIIEGRDSRIVIMAGPCSIHDTDQGLEYADRLKRVANRVSKKILVLMRTYFEKPRTVMGWKGLIVQPNVYASNGDPDDINLGLHLARQFLLDIAEIGVGTVTEFLDPVVPQYIGDLITTGTIGARTTESQTHRQMASGLSMPVGFKNGTDGSLDAGLNALLAAMNPHNFLGINEDGLLRMMQTTGNKHNYLVLRGGKASTNFDAESVNMALEQIRSHGVSSPVVVDCSHGNSQKKCVNQSAAFLAVVEQLAGRKRGLAGVMLESNLNAGRQNVAIGEPLEYGVSITDECIGFDETEHLILEAFGRL